MRFIFLGPQGAGKGTQAAILAKSLDIPHISTGDLLRCNICLQTSLGLQAKSYMDKGALVPDELVLGMVRERLSKPDAQKGWILDGFPRNASQVAALDELLLGMGQPAYDRVISLEVVPEDILVERLEKRAIEQGREDDTPEVIRKRLQIYHEVTAPLIQLYRERHLLVSVNGNQFVEAVAADIQKAIQS